MKDSERGSLRQLVISYMTARAVRDRLSIDIPSSISDGVLDALAPSDAACQLTGQDHLSILRSLGKSFLSENRKIRLQHFKHSAASRRYSIWKVSSRAWTGDLVIICYASKRCSRPRKHAYLMPLPQTYLARYSQVGVQMPSDRIWYFFFVHESASDLA
jgi:hypothetical protein